MKRIFSALIAAVAALAARAWANVTAPGVLHPQRGMVDLQALGFEAGAVVNPAQSEVIRQRLYDFQLYPAAGATSLTFFQQPIGAGITTALGGAVGTAKTDADTNMVLAGQLPSGMAYKIESVEVKFAPGSVATANTYTPSGVGLFIAVSAITQVQSINDVNTIMQSGVLELNVLQKNYLRETPLVSFPPKAFLEVSGAVASNSATTGQTTILHAKSAGRPYYLDMPITLKPALNFEARLKWPGVVPTSSGFNGRIGVIFDGLMVRASQ
jgi:hypothetical protein